MPWQLGLDALPALARGFALLGSGGGGRTTLLEQLARQAAGRWPVRVHTVDELDPRLPCVAVGFAGSTLLLSERVPGDDPFEPLLRAAERWTGAAAAGVCALEGAGLNGLTPLLLSDRLQLVDADLMGRALPRIDQLSLLVDQVPGILVLCGTGGDGILVLDRARGADIEPIVRSALIQSGGVGAVAVAGFTVGDLRTHAIRDSYRRALHWGTTALASGSRGPAGFAEQLGGRLLAVGQVQRVESAAYDPMTFAAELIDDDGALVRLVARSELLAVLRDGRLVAQSPEIIVAMDTISGAVLEVDDIRTAQHVDVIALPAPRWWQESPTRLAAVQPAAFGLPGLESS